MKKTVILLFLLLPTLLIAQQMNVMTFNIRYNNPRDGENAWPNRIDMVNGLIKFHDAEIFGLQEALHDQILDIENGLSGFEWFGVGRDDGKKAGEYSPIFFNKKKFILVEKGHFWLSEDCTKPGLGWDAACTRICTWGKFQSKVSGKQFFVFNTHFDHKGDEARKNSATLIKEKIVELAGNNGLPVVLMGDFNLTPDTEPIKLIKQKLQDTREISATPPYGPVGTFNSFDWNAPMKGRIDYIFVRDIDVLKYAVITDNKESRWPSDHLPVFVKLQLQ